MIKRVPFSKRRKHKIKNPDFVFERSIPTPKKMRGGIDRSGLYQMEKEIYTYDVNFAVEVVGCWHVGETRFRFRIKSDDPNKLMIAKLTFL